MTTKPMTPAERLKEIKETSDMKGYRGSLFDNVQWLISRVEKLESYISKSSKDIDRISLTLCHEARALNQALEEE